MPLMPSSMSPVQFGTARRGTPVALPPGISDLETWGRIIIDFGKLSAQEVSYAHVVKSADPQMISYVKWCKGQVDCSEGCLKDFAMFILAHEHVPDQGLVIPGTTRPRRLR